MKPSTILHTFFIMSQFNVIEDKRRKVALLDCIDALNDKATLTLTGLSRKMRNKHVATKHNIKRVCRLLVMLTYKESEVKYMHLLPAIFYRN